MEQKMETRLQLEELINEEGLNLKTILEVGKFYPRHPHYIRYYVGYSDLELRDFDSYYRRIKAPKQLEFNF